MGGVERDRERTSDLSESVRVGLFCFFLTFFVSCNGPYALKEKWHREEHIIIIIVDDDEIYLVAQVMAVVVNDDASEVNE